MGRFVIATYIWLVGQSLAVCAAQWSPEQRYSMEITCFLTSGAMFKAKGVERSPAAERLYCRCFIESLEEEVALADFTRPSLSFEMGRNGEFLGWCND
jgi:hypothetical protein